MNGVVQQPLLGSYQGVGQAGHVLQRPFISPHCAGGEGHLDGCPVVLGVVGVHVGPRPGVSTCEVVEVNRTKLEDDGAFHATLVALQKSMSVTLVAMNQGEILSVTLAAMQEGESMSVTLVALKV
jgi:hypothetical protein